MVQILSAGCSIQRQNEKRPEVKPSSIKGIILTSSVLILFSKYTHVQKSTFKIQKFSGAR